MSIENMQSIVDVWAYMCRRFPGMPIVLNRDPVAYGRPSAGDARVEFGNAYVMVRDGLVKAYHGAERLEASTIEDLAPILAADDNFNLFLVPEKRVEHDLLHWLPPCCQVRNARINVGGRVEGLEIEWTCEVLLRGYDRPLAVLDDLQMSGFYQVTPPHGPPRVFYSVEAAMDRLRELAAERMREPI